MSTEEIAAIGAFLSGAASIATATWFVRKERRRLQEECDRRLAEYERALEAGARLSREGR